MPKWVPHVQGPKNHESDSLLSKDTVKKEEQTTGHSSFIMVEH